MFSGRKKESAVWKWFEYNEGTDKSACLVQTDGKGCDVKLAGKNSTNLKVTSHFKCCLL